MLRPDHAYFLMSMVSNATLMAAMMFAGRIVRYAVEHI